MLTKDQKSFLKKALPSVAVIASLCCLTPIVLVLFGISTVAFAASLGDTLYYGYKWAFRGAALAFLLVALAIYFYKKENICTLHDLARKRNKVINFTAIVLIGSLLAYLFFTYVILEVAGILLGLW